MTEFEREDRYLVMKRKDLLRLLPDKDLEDLARIAKKLEAAAPLECVVVESDWPEYESVWKMIEDRVTGNKEPEHELVMQMTLAMREADRVHERTGGGTKHHVRDCLLPILEKYNLKLVSFTV